MLLPRNIIRYPEEGEARRRSPVEEYFHMEEFLKHLRESNECP